MHGYISSHFDSTPLFLPLISSAVLQTTIYSSRGIRGRKQDSALTSYLALAAPPPLPRSHSLSRMRNLAIKTREAGPGSPVAGVSPRADMGEVDTSAPFQSVKDAVNLFGEAGSPKASTPKTKKKAEERLLEVEAQHHLMMKAKLYYTHQLRATEAAKAQALRELQMADRTLKQLTYKLQTLTASKQASIEATEAAKIRTKELEEEKARRAQLGHEIFESVVNNQRELYRTTTAELIACQQELENLKHDFDETDIEKAALFRKAKAAEVELQKNQERQSQLKKEVEELRQKFDQVKLASDETEEEYMKLIVEKEELLHSHKSNKERVEKEIERLREEYVPMEILQKKLEETMEAIRVLQEQLHEIQSSDLHAIRQMAKELDEAKRALEEAVAEENSLHTLIDSTKWEVEDVKKRRVEAEKVTLEAESNAEELQAELEMIKAELEKAMSGCGFIMKSCVDKLLDEAEMAKYEAEASKKSAELLREEAKSAAALTQEADRKLQIALKEAEEAKALERLAEERIYCYQGKDDTESNGAGSTRKVRLSVEEFNSMNMKIEECAKKADIEVANANAQVEAINARERETSEKLEAMLKENEALQSEIREALKRAEMAEAARRLVETELQKWCQNERSKTGRRAK